ncbi:MAG: hypothetical protein WED04_00055 [Promethearchaeati archaeon SRVP18_Atabeyarchaeia-1]
MATEEKRFLKLEDIRKRPFCGRDLVEGYMIPHGGLFWDTRKHVGFMHGGPVKWSQRNIPARLCTECDVYMITGQPPYLKTCPKCACEIPIEEKECEFCGARHPARM